MAHQLLLTLNVYSSRTKRNRIMEKKGPRNSMSSPLKEILLTLEKGTKISNIKFSLDSRK